MNTLDHIVAWSSLATGLGTLGLLIAGYIAGRVATRNWKAAKEAGDAAVEANHQARLAIIAQARPYVFVEVLPSLNGGPGFDVRITNSGQSSAHDLALGYEHWPEPADELTRALHKFFRTAHTLPPGRSIRLRWHEPAGLAGSDAPSMGPPHRQGAITVDYQGRNSGVTEHYQETFDIDLEDAILWPSTDSGQHSTTDAASDVAAQRAIARNIGELAR